MRHERREEEQRRPKQGAKEICGGGFGRRTAADGGRPGRREKDRVRW
ncbi:hypothetical protein BVRB_004190 [Beta vulgaris subsp. vulgaris]|uniref:Uncharacterized protein n=1 Tax=Beta vulgaris subsp. vulgaris TaxID=3555 RepID=A0A0J8B4G2_BETVV|nr:hypothetical protein BVRB_004190 [Beta vulgaris subsp. vulgaris]